MANINKLHSYDLNGVKESVANWISNLSPADTPFVSLTAKESIQNKYFQWQEDQLSSAVENAVQEGSDAGNASHRPTQVLKNVTQILRKVVSVSDTANSFSNYGRGKELSYQLEKAGKELKRDIEWALLHNINAQDVIPPGVPTGAAKVRRTAGFEGLVAPVGVASPEDPAAIVHLPPTTAGVLTESDIFKVTQGLYLAGAKATHIMFHPRFASTFAGLMESTGAAATRVRLFDGAVDTKVNKYVSCIVDPLGQQFCLIPNRFMPNNKIYFFNPADWTQMVLRQPTTTLLAKTGSFEKWMLECELGLRHRNRFASGVLIVGVPNNGTAAPSVTTPAAPAAGAFPDLVPFGGAQKVSPYNTVRLFLNGTKTQQITAAPATGVTQNLSYTSNHPEIASVDFYTGLITAHAPGYARIRISTGGSASYVSVYVYADDTADTVQFTRPAELLSQDVPLIQQQELYLDGGAVAGKAADQSKITYKWFVGDSPATLVEDTTATDATYHVTADQTIGKAVLTFKVEATLGTTTPIKIEKIQAITVTPNTSVPAATGWLVAGTGVTVTTPGNYAVAGVKADASNSIDIGIAPDPVGAGSGVISIVPALGDESKFDDTTFVLVHGHIKIKAAAAGVNTGDTATLTVTNGSASADIVVTFA